MTHNTPNLWRYMWGIIKPYKWWYALMFQGPICAALYIFANNYSLKLLIDAFSVGVGVSYSQLMYPITLFIVAQIALDVSWRLSDIAEWQAEPLVRRQLLLRAYDYVQYHSYRFFQNTPSGTVISQLRGMLDGYDAVFSNLHQNMGKSFCIVVVSVAVLLLVNTTVFWFMLLWCLAVVAVLYPMSLKLNQLSNETAQSKHSIMGMFSDNITNIFALFYFAKRKYELKRLDEFVSNDYVKRQKTLYGYNLKFQLVGSVFYWIMLIGVFVFMVHLRKSSAISTGGFIFVMLTAIAISFDLWAFVGGISNFMQQLGDFKASYAILTIPHDHQDASYASDVTIHQGAVEFKDLTFSYEGGAPIFSRLNLTIKPGEKLGIVGHSGAGKSTLVSLLLKNFKLTSGTILIDGIPIDHITADSLRKQIALIPQDIMLFHRTLRENIGYANEKATLLAIKEAASMANIHDYIERLPNQYETLVGERGIKLSTGQRQRIAIARAILKNAPIIILDEATSSLDTVTEQQIQQSINTLLEKSRATVIAIAHRLSTIRHMDRIVVMDQGTILEEGSFTQLMANEQGHFKALWDAQINGMVV